MDTTQIEDIYPLSTMQEAIFQHAQAGPGEAPSHGQLICTLHGKLEISTFQKAWQQAAMLHPILRTSFVWEGLEQPVQVVNKEAEIRLEELDWRDLVLTEEHERFAALALAERSKGLQPSMSQLTRLVLIVTAVETHQLIWTYHPLALDAGSATLILQEVLSSYDNLRNGNEAHTDEGHSYWNFVEWLGQQDLADAETFWKQYLQGITAPTPLPVEQTNSCLSQTSYATQQITLTNSELVASEALRRSGELQVHTLLQGAWALLLNRYSGDEDVTFGVTISGRPPDLSGIETIAGPFSNTLPVRVRVKPGMPVLTWLKELETQLTNWRRYQHYPLAKVKSWSEVPAELPLFETCLSLDDQRPSVPQSASIEISDLQVHGHLTFPISAEMVLEPEVSLRLSYDTSRFESATINRMLDHWRNLFSAMVATPELPVSTLSPLSLNEQQQLLVEFNQTQSDYPNKCIHRLFEEQAELTPAAIALKYDNEQLDYQTLNARSNQLAHQLIELGVGPEVRVGLMVERGVEMVVGVLGILKAGGAYVPLDTDYPADRLRWMIEDSEVPVLVTQSRLLGRIPDHKAHVLSIDEQWEQISRHSQDNPSTPTTPNHLAYVIYTSGSTGRPKGAAIPHAAVVRLVRTTNYVQIEPSDIIAQASNISFDAATFEVWGALLNGAQLVGITKDISLSPVQFADEIRRHKISILFLTTALFNQLGAACPDVFSSIKTLLFGGEACDPKRVRELLNNDPPARLLHVYGPTESTTYATWFLVEEVSEGTVTVPIGSPISNTQTYLLDRSLRPVPLGVPGELYIAGDGLARCYLNQPELTAERFVPHPFSHVPGARLYKTGDLCRYLVDGNIEFIGRIDRQVKIRGFRIEIEEIEATLLQHAAVVESVVAVREGETGDRSLVAYVVADSDSLPALTELRTFLKEHLPEYMLPAAFVRLDKLPLTPNGKVDRQALPEPDSARPELEINFVAPSTPIEEVLVEIWCSVLGVDRVGVEDNFFELGGHSLLATQVITRIRKAFRIDLPLRTIFEWPTVASLATCVKRSLRGGQGLQAPPIVPISRDQEVPLSFAQQRLWFLDQLEPGSSAYNIPATMRLRGPLNIPALEQTFTEITRRHEALRTVFASIEGQPLQVEMPAQPVQLPIVDLSELPEGEREAEAQRLANEEARTCFNLSRGPLLRTRLLKLDDEVHVLLFTMHHIITDGWSMEILIREAALLYASYAAGLSSPLPELPIQYSDFAHWQRSWLQGEVLEAELDYWKRQLADAPVALELPTDHPRPIVQTYSGGSQSLTLSAELTASLKDLCRREGVTQFMTLLAVFQTLLHRYTAQSHISIGSPIANRNRGETESLIGFFVNTLVLCTDLSGDPSFRTLLRRVREVALGAYAHQDLPFEKLVEELQPQRDLSVTPLFQVMFNLVRFTDDDAEIELPGLVVETLPSSESGSKFDLTLYAQEHLNNIHLNLVYNSDLFEPETITRMLGHFQNLLRSAVTDSDQSLSTMQLLSAEEQLSLLERRNLLEPAGPFTEFTRPEIEQSITSRFRQQVDLAPAQIAVKTRSHSWSYEHLGRLADAVAAALLDSCGTGEEQVALLFPHDAPMIAAMLGTLEAGKGYVPLETSFPLDRLSFMLNDAQARALLTDSTQLELAQTLANGKLPVINLDELDLTAATANRIEVEPQRRAYLLYTSGSTGQPKAVVQNHRNLLHHIRCYTNALHLSSHDKLTLLPSYGFDASVMDIFGALLNGATLLPFDLKSEGPAALAAWLRDEEITVYHSTPTVFRYLGAALNESELPQARVVVLGGEAASQRDLEIFKSHFSGDSLLVNGLGPTESTLTLQYFMDHETELAHESLPVGYPVADTEVRLINEFGSEVEIFGVGEIEIRSEHVALGYWRQPELTAAAFSEADGKRTYRTGDLGRRLPDGRIEYLGRKDLQVKIRGHRVEILEVERALTEQEEVRAAAVVARSEDSAGEKRLVAYVVCHDGKEASTSQLRRALETRLPVHMIPTSFVFLDELPLLMNGKIDRNSLPAPDSHRPQIEAEFVTPNSEIERAIAAIWQDVLKLERVGLYDNFFDLGGHSLLVVQVHSRLREVAAHNLSLIEMFNHPTIAALARHLGQQQTVQPTLERSFNRAENRRELLKRRRR